MNAVTFLSDSIAHAHCWVVMVGRLAVNRSSVTVLARDSARFRRSAIARSTDFGSGSRRTFSAGFGAG